MNINEIFLKKYYKIYDLTTDYVLQLILSIFNQMNITKILQVQYCSAEDIKEKLRLHEQSILLLRWMLLFLNNRGYLSCEERETKLYFKLNRSFNFEDPEKIADEILSLDKTIIYSNRLLRSVSEDYPEFLFGRKTGIEILFSSEKANLWRDYFSNDHNGYAVHNYFGALAFLKWISFEESLRILEIGGGIGGGTVALLEMLEQKNLLLKVKEYIFSDISPLFLRSGNQLVMEKLPDFGRVTLKKLDFNKPLCEQKIEAESIDIVYGVNALHVAYDLLFTLKQIRKLLKKNGLLIISECVRANEKSTPQPEFIFNLLDNYRNVKTDPSLRKTVGFLTPDNWKHMFEKAGFKNFEMILNGDIDNGIGYSAIAMALKGQNLK